MHFGRIKSMAGYSMFSNKKRRHQERCMACVCEPQNYESALYRVRRLVHLTLYCIMMGSSPVPRLQTRDSPSPVWRCLEQRRTWCGVQGGSYGPGRHGGHSASATTTRSPELPLLALKGPPQRQTGHVWYLLGLQKHSEVFRRTFNSTSSFPMKSLETFWRHHEQCTKLQRLQVSEGKQSQGDRGLQTWPWVAHVPGTQPARDWTWTLCMQNICSEL